MKIFKRKVLPPVELKEVKIDGRRFYTTPEGNRYPSVTTVLSATKDKTGLLEWRNRVGEKEANRITNRAAKRGTGMHTICEEYLKNNPEPMKGQSLIAIELFNNIRPVLDHHIDEIYGNEISLYSDELKTAGKSDLFCKFMGVGSIVDFKSSTREKREDWIEDYFLQSTCYAMMAEERYRHIGDLYVSQIAIIIALEEGEQKYQLFVKKTRDYRDKVKERFAEYHRLHG